jgi:hypothetical protein
MGTLNSAVIGQAISSHTPILLPSILMRADDIHPSTQRGANRSRTDDRLFVDSQGSGATRAGSRPLADPLSSVPASRRSSASLSLSLSLALLIAPRLCRNHGESLSHLPSPLCHPRLSVAQLLRRLSHL